MKKRLFHFQNLNFNEMISTDFRYFNRFYSKKSSQKKLPGNYCRPKSGLDKRFQKAINSEKLSDEIFGALSEVCRVRLRIKNVLRGELIDR